MWIKVFVKILLFTLLGVSFSIPGAAFVDTVEQYPTGSYTDFWTFADTHTGIGAATCTIVQHPTEYSSMHCLKLSGSTSAAGFTATPTLTTNDLIFENYAAFSMIDYDVSVSGTTSFSCQLINAAGTVVASYTQSSGYGGVYEIVATGTDVYLYQNGVDKGVINNGYYTEGVLCKLRLVNTHASHSGDDFGTHAYFYIDDISDGSAVGIFPAWNEYQAQLESTYRIQGYYQHTDYAYTINVVSAVDGLINSTTLNTSSGVCTWSIPALLEDNYGLYIIELVRESITLDQAYFVYYLSTDPIEYPEAIIAVTSNVGMTVSGANGVETVITNGETVYIFEEGSTDGEYPITCGIRNTPYTFTTTLTPILGHEHIVSVPITFTSLTNYYTVTLDGSDLPGACASGVLTVTGSFSDSETITIGLNTYEFESTGGVTSGNTEVDIEQDLDLTISALATAINTTGLANANIIIIGENAVLLRVNDGSEQQGYQTAFNISHFDGMEVDGSDLCFKDMGNNPIPFWLDAENSVAGSYYKGYVSVPANVDSIILEYATGTGAINSPFITFDQTAHVPTNLDTIAPFDFTGGGLESLAGWTYSGLEILQLTAMQGSYVGQLYVTGSTTGKYFEQAITIPNTDDSVYIHYWAKSWKPTSWGGTSAFYIDNVEKTNIPLDNGGHEYYYDVSAYKGTTITCKWRVYTANNNYDNGVAGQYDDIYITNSSTGTAYSKKYETVEPTFSEANPEERYLHVAALTCEDSANSVPTTETCANASWESNTLTGGYGGSKTTSTSAMWTISDWISGTAHVFSFTPDLTQPGVYGYVRDAETNTEVHAALVTVANESYSKSLMTDETGYYYTIGLVPGSVYTVRAQKLGYAATEPLAVTAQTGATTRKDLYLEPALTDGGGVYYASHYVRLIVVDKTWHKLNATMTVTSVNTTLCTDYTLGDDGAVTLQMTENIKYTIQTTYGGVTQTDYIMPAESLYYIIWDAGSSSLVPKQFYEFVTINVTKTEVDASTAFINVTYTDAKTNTDSVYFVLGQYANNGTFMELQTSQTFTGNSSTGFVVTNYLGETYAVKAYIVHGDFGSVTKNYAVAFGGNNLPFTGKALAYFGVFILFIVAFQFGKAEHASGAIMLNGIGWLFWYVGIFEAFGSGINGLMFGGLILATIYSLAAYINGRRREEGA